jgi:hypothetical protein
MKYTTDHISTGQLSRTPTIEHVKNTFQKLVDGLSVKEFENISLKNYRSCLKQAALSG